MNRLSIKMIVLLSLLGLAPSVIFADNDTTPNDGQKSSAPNLPNTDDDSVVF